MARGVLARRGRETSVLPTFFQKRPSRKTAREGKKKKERKRKKAHVFSHSSPTGLKLRPVAGKKKKKKGGETVGLMSLGLRKGNLLTFKKKGENPMASSGKPFGGSIFATKERQSRVRRFPVRPRKRQNLQKRKKGRKKKQSERCIFHAACNRRGNEGEGVSPGSF